MLMYAMEKMIPARSIRSNDVFLEFGVAAGYSINVTQVGDRFLTSSTSYSSTLLDNSV